MVHLNSTAARVKPFPLLLLSLASCAPVSNFLINGQLPEPASAEVEATPAVAKATPAAAKATPAPTPLAPPAVERRVPSLPINTTFTHGQWHLQRTSRALYGWTGTGEQFRLFAVEFTKEALCWYSQQADRPEAQHCLDGDAPLAASTRAVDGKEVETIFSGFDEAPWKTASADTPLPEGTYALPDTSGRGLGTLERIRNEVTVRTGWTRSERVFTVPSGSNAFLVNGTSPDLFDGCTSANGTIPAFDGIRVRIGKKKCGISRGLDDTTATLSIDQLVLSFSRRGQAPDLAKAQEQVQQLRKMAVGKAELLSDISGDATHTLVAFTIKKPNGVEKSMVEANATIRGIHYRCESMVDRVDPAWVQTVKRICGSMAE